MTHVNHTETAAPKIVDLRDGTARIYIQGQPVATIIVGGTPADTSIDVVPARDDHRTEIEAIAFGAHPVLDDDRIRLGAYEGYKSATRRFICARITHR